MSLNLKIMVLAFAPLLMTAQDLPAGFPRHTVRAQGEAVVTAKPDQARIAIGVTTTTPTADEAVRQDAAKTEAIVAAIKGVLGTEGELQTDNYTLGPQYRYSPNQSPVLTGYQANHTVRVTINNLSLVGKVIDAAAKAGANTMNRIEFALRNDQNVKAEALKQAAAHARANAENVAQSLGLTVTGVASAETNEVSAPRPVYAPMMKTMAMGEAATQVETGSVEYHASVTVFLDIK